MSRLRDAHPSSRRRRSRHAAGYTNGWARRSKRAIAEHVAAHGMTCPGVASLGIAPHAVDGHGGERLTGNHRTSLQLRRRLGLPLVDDEPIDVMCQGCNTRLGEAERRDLAGIPRGTPSSAAPYRPAEPSVDPWFA